VLRIAEPRCHVSPSRGDDAIISRRFTPDRARSGGSGTISLPETSGGERNWDCRYTWMRDTTLTLQARHYLNLDWEAWRMC
jgi:hypothetical protein